MPLLLLPLGAGTGSGPTPPAPPAPSTGDGVALIAGGYIEHRQRLRERGDPWSELAAWLRKLGKTAEWVVTREQQAAVDRAAAFQDEQDIDDVSKARRRR